MKKILIFAAVGVFMFLCGRSYEKQQHDRIEDWFLIK
jgi:hypothetical protein